MCGIRGTSIEVRTVKALLADSALARLRCVSHRFCRTPECQVVYYDEMAGVYLQNEIRARVWQKEVHGDRPVCYCFGETETTIRTELREQHESTVVARVRQHIDAGRCACDVRNPRGVCCLGDLILAVTRVREESLKASMGEP